MFQTGAPEAAREAPRARGDARGDGAHPAGHAGRRPDPPRPVETALLQVLPGKGEQILRCLFSY